MNWRRPSRARGRRSGPDRRTAKRWWSAAWRRCRRSQLSPAGPRRSRRSAAAQRRAGHAVPQTLERPLRARRSVAGRTGAGVPRDRDRGRAAPPSRRCRSRARSRAAAPAAEAAAKARPARRSRAAKPSRKPAPPTSEVPEGDKVANQSIRVNVDTLENLMTMVTELVLTRNQLLQISRRKRTTNSRCRCSA